MFRQRGSGYGRSGHRRRAGQRRPWALWLAALAGCGAVALGLHLATAPQNLDAASAANVFRAGPGTGKAGGGTTATPSRHGYGRGGYTMMPHTTTEAAAATTMNWSGYVTTGTAGTFSTVSSSWAQPAVTCGAADTFSSFWVGLDGVGTPTLEQSGTEADCSAGTPVYAGWYEIFPAAPVFYNAPVQPGDAMRASVTAAGSGGFTLTLTDATRNWTRAVTQAVPGAERASAEIIAEAPSSQGVLPLADFGTVHFSDATVDGQPAGDRQLVALTLVSGNGTAEATPSPLTSATSFTVTWSSSGTMATRTAAGTGAAGSGTSPAGHRHHHHRQDQG